MWILIILMFVAGAAHACDPDSISVSRAADGPITIPLGEARWGQWWDYWVICEGDTLKYTRARIRADGSLAQANVIIPIKAAEHGDVDLRRMYARRQLFIREIGAEMGKLMRDQMGVSFDSFLRAAKQEWLEQDSTLTKAEASVHWNAAYSWWPATPNAVAQKYATMKGFETVNDMLDEIILRMRHIE